MDEWPFKDLNKEKDSPHIRTVYAAVELVRRILRSNGVREKAVVTIGLFPCAYRCLYFLNFRMGNNL
jgi:hypothetical protein